MKCPVCKFDLYPLFEHNGDPSDILECRMCHHPNNRWLAIPGDFTKIDGSHSDYCLERLSESR